MIYVHLFARFLVISLVAFGGGQAAIPLVERVAVQDTGWLTPSSFGTALALSYITPGPVLIIATFVGFQVAGVLGAVISTFGAFIAPWALAGLAAQHVKRFAGNRYLKAFGAGAAPAVVGVLGLTVVDLGRAAFASWPFVAVGAVVFALGRWTRVHPVVLLILGGLAGHFISR